jgi:hypothetical protein
MATSSLNSLIKPSSSHVGRVEESSFFSTQFASSSYVYISTTTVSSIASTVLAPRSSFIYPSTSSFTLPQNSSIETLTTTPLVPGTKTTTINHGHNKLLYYFGIPAAIIGFAILIFILVSRNYFILFRLFVLSCVFVLLFFLGDFFLRSNIPIGINYIYCNI